MNYLNDMPRAELITVQHRFIREATDLVVTSWNPNIQEWSTANDAMNYFKLNAVLAEVNRRLDMKVIN